MWLNDMLNTIKQLAENLVDNLVDNVEFYGVDPEDLHHSKRVIIMLLSL